MFESIRHWFASIREDSRLFVDADDEVLHSALASLLYHFISVDERHGDKEKHEFARLMHEEFELDAGQIEHLYEAAKTASGDLHDDFQVINEHLKDSPATRMRFMQRLLQLINIHGTHSDELALFYETLHEVFPELHGLGNA